MSDNEKLKVHIHYGGLMEKEGNKLCYRDGLIAPDMLVDPDLLTFSLFEDFSKNGELVSDVEKLWYRLPNEELSEARSIWHDKDKEIMQMASEAKDCGEVYVYVGHSVSTPTVDGVNVTFISFDDGDDGHKADDEYGSDDDDRDWEEKSEASDDEERDSESEQEERAEESDEEDRAEDHQEVIIQEETRNDEGGVQSEDENQILGVGGDTDPRFASLFAIAEATPTPKVHGDTTQPSQVDEGSDVEDEPTYPPGEYPDSPEDTDEEWANWQKKDDRGRPLQRGKSKAEYDKPPYLWLMQTFSNGDEFKDQLLRYVLKTQFDVKLNKWHHEKLAAVCTHENCKWRIYCSMEKPIRKWMVKVFVNSHNHLPTGRARMLKQGTIARLFKEEARRRPEIRSSDIKDDLMHNYKISVSIYKCRKARRIALDMVLDTQKEQFAKLWDYEAELIRSNKEVKTDIVTVEKNGRQVFESFYVSFEPLRRLWKQYCRPLIGLDGAFLKWELKGEILAAVGRDAENRIYPIAWAVVRGENKESWEWFIKRLKADLDLKEGDGVTFISDRQKGLQIALATVLPNAEHRNCAKHVYGNWKKTYGDCDYKPFFWNVAYSKTMGEYNLHMEELRVFHKEAHDDLLAAEPKTWCLAFFSNNARSANVCNSLSESFNRTIKGARELPLIKMLETIRRQTMTRIARRFIRANRCILPFPKKIGDMLEKHREDSKDCVVLTSSDNLFEVCLGDNSCEVSIRLRHCTCRGWDLTGIPCSHAIRVINEKHQRPENHMDYYYQTAVWIKTYRDNIKPVSGELFWDKTGKEPIDVPGFRKMPGRPKKKRMKPVHESPSKPNRVTRHNRTVTCGNCKQVGHNRGTCKNEAYVVQAPTRKRGRPSKIREDGGSNTNPPKRRKVTQSQPSNPPTTLTQSQSSLVASTAPQPSSTLQGASSIASSTAARGRGRGRGRRGRPPGRGQARRQVSVPRGVGVYMCPFSNRVFECFGSHARDIGGNGSSSQGPN